MKSRYLSKFVFALMVLVLTVSCDSLLGGEDDPGGDDAWDGGRIPLGTDVGYRISPGSGAYEIHTFATDAAGDYEITVSNFSDEASLLWYLFESEQNAEDYFGGTNLPNLVIAQGAEVDTNPQTARTGDLTGTTTYYLGIQDFRDVGSDYTVNVSVAD